MRTGRFSLVLLAICSIHSGAAAATATLVAARDNTLYEDANGGLSNGAGPVLFAGRTGQGLIRRATLMFDLSGSLPAGATIDSVALVLRVSMVSDPDPRTMTLHRLAADWGEGASSTGSGSGAAATPGDATWLHTFYPTVTWSNAGGDFDASESASTLVLGLGVYSWKGPGMAHDVETWLGQPGSNHGWLLRGDESEAGTTRRFESREATIDVDRPALVVYYTADTSRVSGSSWGHLKTRYR